MEPHGKFLHCVSLAHLGMMLLLSMIHCPTDAFSLAVTGLQCLNLAAFANEMQAPTGYSKFASGKATMPSKTGMLLICASPALYLRPQLWTLAPHMRHS